MMAAITIPAAMIALQKMRVLAASSSKLTRVKLASNWVIIGGALGLVPFDLVAVFVDELE